MLLLSIELFVGQGYPWKRSAQFLHFKRSLSYYYQITKAAREHDPIKRAEYIQRISKYQPHERVYVDESRFDQRNATRNRAWALHGERALRRVFFLRGKRYAVYRLYVMLKLTSQLFCFAGALPGRHHSHQNCRRRIQYWDFQRVYQWITTQNESVRPCLTQCQLSHYSRQLSHSQTPGNDPNGAWSVCSSNYN